MSTNTEDTPRGGGNVLKLLRMHGWGTGFHNPFSNEENKALEKQLERLQRRHQLVGRDLELINEHVENLRQHEYNLNIDIKLVQDMSAAKLAHLQDERVIQAQSEKDNDFTVREHRNLTHNVEEFKERNRRLLMVIEKRQKDFNNSMSAIETDRQLAKFLHRKENDMHDEMNQVAKLKELDKGEVKRVHMDMDNQEKINRTLTMSLENNLRKTSEASEQYRRLCLEFRHAHRKRKEMLQLWTATLAAVRARDDDLEDMAAEYYELRERLKSQVGTHDCLTAFFTQRAEEIEEINYRYQYYEMELRSSHEKLEKHKLHLMALKTDHAHLVSATHKLTMENQVVKQRIKLLHEEMEGGLDKEERVKKELSMLQQNRDHVHSIAFDQEKLVRELDDMIEAEEERLTKLEYQGVQVRKFLFEKTNERADLEGEIGRVNTRMNLIHRIFARLHAREYDNTSLMAKRQSRLYRADLEVSTAEMKISRILSSTVEPRYFRLQMRAERLRNKNHHIQSTNAFVAKEGERAAVTLQALVDDIESHRVHAKHMDSFVDERRLSLTEVERECEATLEHLKQLKLEYNLMKINAVRLKNSVSAYGGKIFSLSQIRNLFQTAGFERKSEIEFHAALIRKKTALLKKEILFLEHSAYRTNGTITKLKVLFELTSGVRMDASEDKLVDPSKNLYDEMRDVFRERTMLKTERFQWEAQVDQDMQELEGLTNALAILKGSNEAYKLSLKPAAESGGDSWMQELEILEKRVSVYRNRCQRHVAQLQEHAHALKNEIGITRAGMYKATAKADEVYLDISTYKNDSKYLQERIARWDQLISRISTDEPIWKEQGLQYFIELELNQKMIEEKYEHAMRKILALMKQDPNVRKTIYSFLRDHEMMDQFMVRMQMSQKQVFDHKCQLGGEDDLGLTCKRPQVPSEAEWVAETQGEDWMSNLYFENRALSEKVLPAEPESDPVPYPTAPNEESQNPSSPELPYCD